MRLRPRQSAVTVLNITPMIDVVFILLVFFMLATNFANFRLIRVDTPEETKVVDEAEAAIVILLKEDGSVLFDAEPIEPDRLTEAVARVIAIDPGRAFLIRPEEGVSLQRAIDAFGEARAAGAVAISFSPPREETGGAAP